MMAMAPDGHGTGSARPRGADPRQRGGDTNETEGSLGPVPPPLPSDPAFLAELRASLDRGVADAVAGRGSDARTVHARLRAKYNLP